MSIKSIALVAATIAATASFASADSYFEYNENLESGTVLDLGIVRAEGAGVVEIYDYGTGELGALLGTETVNAGANADVRVNVGANPKRDVIAILKVDGQAVAQRDYDINS
ncbi:hypothetical protein BC777_3595 [Yoonia maricola]|uniref:Uncharacterized protein n=1 Tax=Yoonia maricola TaxID=420999 RepID=A0A2M8W0S3_9RHOB|nr:hypothetical protein [Yoonia maricola]PJI84534.1 hypothetical protein BC777_3595 [Yoonia maricola]